MSLSERIQQINREISATVERAIAELRQDLTQRLRASSDEILRHVGEIAPQLPSSFLAHEDLGPATEQLARDAASAAAVEVREAAAAIDRSRSQAEVLAALLRESARFASRAAVLIVRGGEMRGWGGHGFGDAEPAIRDLSFAPAAGGGWSHLAQGAGAVRLNSQDSAELCSRIEAPLPHEGILIPLVLRDRVAAGLYADRLDGAELGVEALQILAHAAAQAIETLPFRERSSTPTLALDGGATASPPASTPTASRRRPCRRSPRCRSSASPRRRRSSCCRSASGRSPPRWSHPPQTPRRPRHQKPRRRRRKRHRLPPRRSPRRPSRPPLKRPSWRPRRSWRSRPSRRPRKARRPRRS